MRRSPVVVVALLLAPEALAKAQSAYLVADLSSYVWSQPSFATNQLEVADLNGLGFFVHDDGIHGSELWRTDGTALGTFMLIDLCPGLCGNRALTSGSRMSTLGDQLLFAGNDGVHGSELWRTDGTALGTSLTRDIRPGVAPSSPGNFLAAGGQVFFTADDGTTGAELWRTDGTAKGTYLVEDIVPGPGGHAIHHLAVGTGELFLAVGGAALDPGLWISDGTPEGTSRISEIEPSNTGSGKGAAFLALESGVLVYTAETNVEGSELWRSDGTEAGTFQVADLLPGPDGSYPSAFVRLGGLVLFRANSSPSFPTGKLWKTDGTPAGTALIPTPGDFRPRLELGMHAVQDDNYAVFAGEDSGAGTEPWAYDGETLVALGDLRPGASSSIDPISNVRFDHAIFATTGNRITFLADDGVSGLEFWSTDGTPAGTVRVSELFDDWNPPFFDYYAQFVVDPVLGSSLLVRQWDSAAGFRLFRADGTAGGTILVDLLGASTSSFLPRHDGSSPFSALGPYCAEAAGSSLGFQVLNGALGNFEMWGTDGSASGTARILEIAGDAESVSHLGCTSFQNRVYFLGDDGGTTSLWASGGTPNSTELVAPLETLPSSSGGVRPYFVQGATAIYFGGGDWLWSSDGSAGGTTALTGIAQYYYGGLCLAAPERLFYSDFELSVTDPIPGGEVHWIDLNSVDPSYPSSLAALTDGTLLFSAYDNALGDELWRSDGTENGTALVRDIRPGPLGSFAFLTSDFSDEGFPAQIVSLDSVALLAADEGNLGKELWITNGTLDGTYLLKDIYPGDYPSTPRNLTRFGNRVFFTAESELEGMELWATDGTYDGTVLVKDIAPGGASSVPDDLVVRDGVLYFSAWSPNYGREVWKSDGTSAGTIRITDIAPGPKSSSPQRFARAGNRLFFSATDHAHGYELWAISDDGSIPLFLDGFENESTSRWSATVP